MPLLSLAHSHYWSGAVGGPGTGEATPISYPRWMTSVTTVGSGFGALQPVWTQLVTVLTVVRKGDDGDTR